MLEVLLETPPLLGRTQLHEVRLQPVEILLDLLVGDQLEHAELVELGRSVEDEISNRHVAGAADLVADPGVNLGDNHVGRYLEELRRAVRKDHGRDLVGKISLQEQPLLVVTCGFGPCAQTELSLEGFGSPLEITTSPGDPPRGHRNHTRSLTVATVMRADANSTYGYFTAVRGQRAAAGTGNAGIRY